MTQLRARATAALFLTLLVGSAQVTGTATSRTEAAAPDAPTAASLREPSVAAVPGGALDTDCAHVAGGLGGPGYQFIVGCPGRSESPDGRSAVVLRGGEGGGVILTGRDGRLQDEIPNLADAMPFVLFWSPRSNWFFANHYLGSGLDRLRVFEIVNGSAIERSAVFAEATKRMVRRYPCLGRGASIVASGWKWSRDGRRIAMIVYARPDSCGNFDAQGNWQVGPNWHRLWMIGDVESGRIDPASVRIRRDGEPMPTDGPYATL
jgi:hypothetical protein